MAFTPTPEGDAVLFLRSATDSMTRDLYILDTATGEERLFLRAQDQVDSEGPLPTEEKARRERQRMIAAGIAQYQLSRDGRFILAPLSGRLFVVERATGKVRKLESKAGWPIDPRWSADAAHIAYVVDHDLYVIDVASGREIRLTKRKGENIYNGEAEFVAQEEMDRSEGFWWSPDGKFLAYQETDVTPVEVLHIADASHPEAPPQTWPYPRAGTNNANVRVGVLPVRGGRTVWIDWNRQEFPYLAKVTWSDGAPLTILVQNRTQTEERLLAVDAATGKTRTLLEERDPAWLNLDPTMPRWLDGGKSFLWTTERQGSWQLELRRADGSLDHTITQAEFPYRDLTHVDEAAGVVYVEGNAGDDPTQVHEYRVPMSGAGAPVRMTEGRGIHITRFSRNGAVYVHTMVGMDGPARARVVRADGEELATIRSDAAEPPFEANLEITSVAAEGRTQWAFIVRPRDFDSSRTYPVLVHVYGGPHHQMVTASGRRYLMEQFIADHGFVVVGIDGRGTPNRGRAWERVLKGDLATVPVADQVAGLQALGAKYRELDLTRVGIWGWSFGGYMAAMAVLRRPDVFHVGIAGAPVTDWHDYDTHYTERYMGLPQDNPDGYHKASVLAYVDALERPLMIIHGTGDDNVYLMHSLKLVDALMRVGKPFVFIPLLGHTHMVAEPELRLQLDLRIIEFFIENLRP